MKKLFTPDNLITGLMVMALVFAIYMSIELMTQHWVFVLITLLVFPVANVLGYFINKLANKYIK